MVKNGIVTTIVITKIVTDFIIAYATEVMFFAALVILLGSWLAGVTAQLRCH